MNISPNVFAAALRIFQQHIEPRKDDSYEKDGKIVADMIETAISAERERITNIVREHKIYEGSDHPVCNSIIHGINNV